MSIKYDGLYKYSSPVFSIINLYSVLYKNILYVISKQKYNKLLSISFTLSLLYIKLVANLFSCLYSISSLKANISNKHIICLENIIVSSLSLIIP